MMNFFSSDVLELRKKYKNEKAYTKVAILRELIAIAFENGGSLPNRFDIHLKGVDGKSIAEVFEDAGFELKNYNIFFGAETICVSVK